MKYLKCFQDNLLNYLKIMFSVQGIVGLETEKIEDAADLIFQFFWLVAEFVYVNGCYHAVS